MKISVTTPIGACEKWCRGCRFLVKTDFMMVCILFEAALKYDKENMDYRRCEVCLKSKEAG